MIVLILGFLLFCYLAWEGYKALKPQILDPRTLFILPLIFIVLSIWTLIVNFQGWLDLLVWIGFLLMGYALGLGLAQSRRVRIDKQKRLVGLSGSPTPLILVIIFFGVKLFCRHFPMGEGNFLQPFNLIVSSLVTGAFAGLTMATLKKLSKAKHEKLRRKK